MPFLSDGGKQMNDESPVFELSMHLALFSIMAVGGGLVLIAPEVRQFVVDDKHWLLGEQFAAAYAIAQAAPGPNLLFISLVGWLVGGWPGAICGTLAVILPSTALTLAIVKWKSEQLGSRLSRAVGNAFAPMSVGLLGATAWLFMQASNADWRADVLTALSALIVLRTRINPVALIAAGATIGIMQVI
jgi:chromate transporter